MAESSENKSDKSQIDETAEDAVELEDAVEDTAETSPDEDQTDVSDDPDDIDDDELAEDHTDLEETSDQVMDVEEVEPAPEPDELPEPSTRAAPQNSSGMGILPLFLGGIAAGALGYAFALYGPNSGLSEDVQAALDAQAARVAELEAQVASVGDVDLSGLEASIQALSDQVNDLASSSNDDGELAEQLAALDARLIEVEKLPSGDGTLSDTALAAYQRELDALRAELDAQQDAVMSAAAQAEADLQAARAEAERLEQEALAAAEAAAARAAINRVATAVETGAPFADAVSDLGLSDIPAALVQAGETGVATTAELVADFPAVARSALSTARAEGLSDDAGGLSGFLRSQFDVRSTTPQEGPGPDAVLSRAEAAIKEGRVADALAELEGLPEVARGEMADWTARAQVRADVLDALATLSETYQ